MHRTRKLRENRHTESHISIAIDAMIESAIGLGLEETECKDHRIGAMPINKSPFTDGLDSRYNNILKMEQVI